NAHGRHASPPMIRIFVAPVVMSRCLLQPEGAWRGRGTLVASGCPRTWRRRYTDRSADDTQEYLLPLIDRVFVKSAGSTQETPLMRLASNLRLIVLTLPLVAPTESFALTIDNFETGAISITDTGGDSLGTKGNASGLSTSDVIGGVRELVASC